MLTATPREVPDGGTFDGVEAARCGLVTATISEADLPESLAALAADFARVSPQGLRETKALLNRPLVHRIDEQGAELVALSARLFASDEAREGMTAFRERRPPAWVPGAKSD